MHEFEFNTRVMGTSLSVAIITDSEVSANNLYNATYARLLANEAEFSRFQSTSELSILNATGTHTVSPLFIEVLTLAKDLYLKTDGYFNPLLQIERHGYIHTYMALKDETLTKNSDPYNIDLQGITIDTKNNIVRLGPGQKLDFGGFLKGFLAEKEARRIKESDTKVQGVIVNIGGDIHTRGRDEHNEQFIFEIENYVRGDSFSVHLENASLATSGTYKRTWVAGNEQTHHILARSGTHNPKTDVISVSIIHERGAYAEAYAKVLFSLDPEIFAQKINEHLIYVIINQDGTIRTSL